MKCSSHRVDLSKYWNYFIFAFARFTGKYRLADAVAGRHGLADVRERLYQVIRQGRPEHGWQLSDSGRGLSVAAAVPWFRGFWLVAGTVSILGLLFFNVFVLAQRQIGGTEFAGSALKRTAVNPIVAAPATVPRLARLLEPEIAAHQVQVRDQALESVVTLLGETLFESGSAEPSGRSAALLGRVAGALDQVEGPVLVTGHTDNVPSRGLRFSSNHELSQERARNVRRLLAAHMRDSGRITVKGVERQNPWCRTKRRKGERRTVASISRCGCQQQLSLSKRGSRVKFLQNHKRWLIGAFAIFAAALIIWLVGPLIDIGDPRLLEAPARRGIIILLILLGWLSWEGRRLWRERQSNRELIDQLGQAEDPDVAQSREEAEALRGRFTEALSTLKSVKLGGARLLYQLPWYMFIGAPGSGKTTALVNSGLKFPLAQGGVGGAALGGIGGTRNCDWWFADDAVLIDTAGRYTTQDSNAKVDQAAWGAFWIC
jgi:outer membrane protein OmpA-like peptidoglycan-associated protein